MKPIGCAYPVDLIRAIQPSGQEDAIELILVGNVDA